MDKTTALMDQHALSRAYYNIFKVVRANTPTLMDEVHKLRYQIYCVENPFENAGEHPDGRERDRYDVNSMHHLLIHRASGLAVGTVRMVLPNEEDLHRSFPIQAVCPDIEALKRPLHIRRASEISRFCISREIRKRIEDDPKYASVHVPGALESENEYSTRRIIYHAMLGLMRACIDVVQERGIDTTYLICEPALLRIFNKLSVAFTPVGPMVNYHGQRQSVIMNDVEVLEHAQRNNPAIWAILSDNGRLHPEPLQAAVV